MHKRSTTLCISSFKMNSCGLLRYFVYILYPKQNVLTSKNVTAMAINE